MIPVEQILFGTAVLLLLSIVASKASGRLGVPALVLFLAVGMLAGSEGPGGIHFDDAHLAQAVGVVALVIILFAGGLDTRWESVRPVLGRALALSTVGVLITALLVGLFACVVLRVSLLEGLLLGSIVSSTDAAAVFAVLRSKNLGLKGEIKPLLEFESGSNDPMAVFLTIGFTNVLMHPEASLLSLIPTFVWQMLLGGLLGYLIGRVAVAVVNGFGLGYAGLYPVLVLAIVFLSYGVTTLAGGNGFLAVYITGLVMGNHHFLHKRSVTNFYDGLAWLMQIAMFLTMGLLVFPSRLVPVVGVGLLVALFLMFVARPLRFSHAAAFEDERPRQDTGRLGRPARLGPDYPCDLSAPGRFAAVRHDLQHRLFHCSHVRPATGHFFASGRAAAWSGRACRGYDAISAGIRADEESARGVSGTFHPGKCRGRRKADRRSRVSARRVDCTG